MAPLSFTSEAKQAILENISKFASRALIGRFVGYRRIRGSFRDWIIASIRLRGGGRIEDILLLGRSTFMLLLSSEECASALLEQSPLPCSEHLVFLVQWYSDFDLSSFEDRCQVPRFPVKLSFPGLPPEFRVPQVLSQFGALFGTPFQGSIQLRSSVPSLMVATHHSMDFPDSIRYEWADTVRSQVLTVTGRPNQCLNCHLMGHLVKDCPTAQTWRSQPRARHQQQQQPHQAQRQQQPQQTQRQRQGSESRRQTQHAGSQASQGQQRSLVQRSSERLPVKPRMVYRRRQKPTEEVQTTDIQATDRPPEIEVQDIGATLCPIVEEAAAESPSEDLVQESSQVSEALSWVPMTADVGQAVEDHSFVSRFPSPSMIPLSMFLPDFFFASGPWRYPDPPIRPGPLQVDMILLAEGSSGDPVFWGTLSQPMVRFMFQTLHDQAWDAQSVADALYDQIILEAEGLFGPQVHHLLSSQFDDAIGRLVWSDRESFWSLPMVFYMEADRQPPTLIRIWDISRAATFLQVGCVELCDWMTEMFRSQCHGFSVLWTV